MNTTACAAVVAPGLSPSTSAASSRPHLDKKPGVVTALVFLALLVVGLAYTAMSLVNDVGDAGVRTTSYTPYVLLGIALLIALGFEFVNGFHDTANVVATVIYTHSLPPNVAVLWSAKAAPAASPADPRKALSEFVRTKALAPDVVPALAAVTGSIGAQIKEHGTLARVPAEAVANVRNDMYLASEAIRFLEKGDGAGLDADAKKNLKAFKSEIDDATKFIPLWVKVAVAIALASARWSAGSASS
jgi:hypothetical protein